jgi:hypothetical protein
VEQQLRISTDLGEGAVPAVTVQAEVEAAAAAAAPTEQSASVR